MRPPLLAQLALGFAGGLLSGVFGVGGGVILVPGLVLLFGMDQRRANATSLVGIIPIAITGTVGYALGGNVDPFGGLVLASSGIAGSLLGARLLPRVPLNVLRWGMASLLILSAVRLALPDPGAQSIDGGMLLLIPIGFLAGMLAGLLGIGGGIIMVPAMVLLIGSSSEVARGTSLMVVIITATFGAISHLRARRADGRIGATLGLAGIPGAILGSAAGQQLPERLALGLFAGLMVVSAVELIRRKPAAALQQ